MRAVPLLAALLLLSGPSLAPAATWHVSPDGTGDAPTLQAAIDSSANGDTVLAAPGTYTGPGNHDIDFGGRAIVVRSSAGAAATAIDGGGTNRGFRFHAGETLQSAVEGFTITNCFGVYPGGAGILVEPGANPAIRSCVITGNQVDNLSAGVGGGIRVWDADAYVEGCVISWNEGSGIYASGNVTARRCTVRANSSADFGGGIAIWYGGATIDSCVITGNVTGTCGGGVGVSDWGDSYINLHFSTVAGNYAGTSGGGLGMAGDYWSWEPTAKSEAVRSPSQSAEVGGCVFWGNCAETAHTSKAAHAGNGLGTIAFLCSIVDTLGVPDESYHQYFWSSYGDPLFCDPTACDGSPTVAGDYSVNASSPALGFVCAEQEIRVGAYDQGCDMVTAVAADGAAVPAATCSLAGHPNPFNPSTTVEFDLAEAGVVSLAVHDVTGRLVATLAKERMEPGIHSRTWDGRDSAGRELGSGTYFVRLVAGGEVRTEKMILIR